MISSTTLSETTLTAEDRAMQQKLYALAGCVHGWVRRSRMHAGHRMRCQAHRRRVRHEYRHAPPPAYVGLLQ